MLCGYHRAVLRNLSFLSLAGCGVLGKLSESVFLNIK